MKWTASACLLPTLLLPFVLSAVPNACHGEDRIPEVNVAGRPLADWVAGQRKQSGKHTQQHCQYGDRLFNHE